MRYLSLCSGIDAASVAWRSLGWQPVAFAEIAAFPAALLSYRYPDVPNLGDLRGINGADFRGKSDVLVGGTPCQSFSVAGRRRGLEDERGNLALEFVRIADESAPAFVVWENVPGVLSDRGNAFGCFLGALAGETSQLEPPGGRWANAGYVLGPGRAIAWRILDAQYFGLAQRRRRVFVVACPRSGADPRKVLFEYGGLRRDSAPSREAGADVAGTLDASLGSSRGAGTTPGAITQALTGHMSEGGPDDNKAQGGFYVPEIVAQALSCKLSKGTSGPAGDEYHNLVSTTFSASGIGAWREGIGPLRAREQDSHENLCVALQRQVRRLTPRECERLQGFPDDYTLIPYRGKPAADCPDGPRYKALGNSMAVPVMRWVGQRIDNQTARRR